MNRILKAQLGRIARAVDRIDAAAAASADEIVKLRARRQELMQEAWRHEKKAAVLAESSEAYESLRAENAELRERLEQARALAGRLRALAGALKAGAEQ